MSENDAKDVGELYRNEDAAPITVGDVNDNNDDDEDNWSRQVELCDEATEGFLHDDSIRMESVNELRTLNFEGTESMTALDNIHANQLSIGSSVGGGIGRRNNVGPEPPVQPELTMKEKLVLRERQRRIETERARLKRQFALSGTSEANYEDNTDFVSDSNSVATGHGGGQAFSLNHSFDGEVNRDTHHSGRDGSIAEGTIGEESTRAHPDHESPAQDETARLGFNMERFLQNNDSFNPQLEPMEEIFEIATHITNSEQGVVMERFLSEPVVLPPIIEGESSRNDGVRSGDNNQLDNELMNDDRGIANDALEGQRNVSFDVSGPYVEQNPSFGYDLGTNASLASNTSVHAEIGENESTASDDIAENSTLSQARYTEDILRNDSNTISLEQPRVLRLTEADMQEMAAIEDASIGNAPPSEREEEMLSELGELADFGTGHHIGTDNTAASLDTTTTAMESASQISDGVGYHGSRIIVNSQNIPQSSSSMVDVDDTESRAESVDHPMIPALSSHLILSPGEVSNHSIAANPPSVVDIDEEDTTDRLAVEDDCERGVLVNDIITQSNLEDVQRSVTEFTSHEIGDEQVNDICTTLLQHELKNLGETQDTLLRQEKDEIPHDLLFQYQNSLHPTTSDGHDYNKESHQSESFPEHDYNISTTKTPTQLWLNNLDANDVTAPLLVRNADHSLEANVGDNGGREIRSQYGSTVDALLSKTKEESPGASSFTNAAAKNHADKSSSDEESMEKSSQHSRRRQQRALLRNNIIANRSSVHSTTERRYNGERNKLVSDTESMDTLYRSEKKKRMPRRSIRASRDVSFLSWDKRTNRFSVHGEEVVECIFQDLRLHNEVDDDDIDDDSLLYFNSSVFRKAFPERTLALIATLILEVPIMLYWIQMGGQLCKILGTHKYNVLYGMVPLANALAGNVGLQSSTLTIRAVSYSQVDKHTYFHWLYKEIATSAALGLVMGIAFGSIAYVAGGFDLVFGVVLGLGQFASIVMAGLTGTFAPLCFSFIFHRDAGKWGGPLETAIQDIVGIFVSGILSYKLFQLFGERAIDENDVCHYAA